MPSPGERAANSKKSPGSYGTARQAASHTDEEIRSELEAVLDSSEFRSSHRGQALLRYLVENAIQCGAERLKERTIGVELFHREAAYDTGQDAIVRVAVNDVRKRLAAHYEHADPARSGSRVRISLAPGTYTPDFESPEPRLTGAAESVSPLPPSPPQREGWRCSVWIPCAIGILLLGACAVVVRQNLELRSAANAQPGPLSILPWSHLATPGTGVTVVAADANFSIYKALVNADQPLTVYTSHPWLEEIATRVPSVSDLSRMTLTSIADASLSARIGSLLQRAGCSTSVRSARMMQVDDFKSDRPAILLGSAYANPWVTLLNDHLNFRIEYDPVLRKQVCKNRSPLPGELAVYVGTAHTPEPGTAYATISLVPNLSGDGFVLILAGTNMEGTEAAGEWVTDLPRLESALRGRRIDPGAKVGQLELLIRLDHMNTQASRSEIIAQRVTR